MLRYEKDGGSKTVTTGEFHRQAMELLDSAIRARQRGDDAASKNF